MDSAKQIAEHAKAAYGGLSRRQLVMVLGQNIGLSLGIAWLFYDNLKVAFLLFLPVSYANGLRYAKGVEQKKKEVFAGEYRQMLKNIVSALEAGYSVENAFADAQRQQEMLFGKSSVLAGELQQINAAVALRTPIEKAFGTFAQKYPYEEVTSFSEIFSFGKRLGGGYVENLRRTAVKLEERMMLRQDIDATIAQKRLELSIMCVMPAAIIVYMRVGSPAFLSPMYHNAAGIVIMTTSAIFYVVAMYIGSRVVDIVV